MEQTTPSLDKVAVIIPTLNAAPYLARQLPTLAAQGLAPWQMQVIDSASNDDTVALARTFGAHVHVIARKDFNHGGTRRLGAALCSGAEILVFLTQDAIPARMDAIARITNVFEDASVGMAYGRQLPRPEARAIERYARLRNYPVLSEIRQLSDRDALGIKTIFSSDSFAAYRAEALMAVGSFPFDCYFAEDQIVAARMLLQKWKLAYVADAEVIHSHEYTLAEDFKRNFDVGVFHANNLWLLREFGSPEKAGFGFVAAEIGYLLRACPWAIPSALLRTLAKYIGYRLGRKEAYLSRTWKSRLSMQPFYWQARPD